MIPLIPLIGSVDENDDQVLISSPGGDPSSFRGRTYNT